MTIITIIKICFGNTLSLIEKINGLNKPNTKENYKIFRESTAREEVGILPSKRSFFSYKNKEFKRARRMTDLCDYCELSLVLKKNINTFILSYFPDVYNEIFDLNRYSDFFKTSQIQPLNLLTEEEENESDDADESKSSNDTKITLQNISNQLELVRLIGFHQQMAEKQRNLYNKMTHDPILLNDSIMIEMDFKQKIVFGNQILLFMFLFIFIIFSKIIYFRYWSKANKFGFLSIKTMLTFGIWNLLR
jgi:hypothetical protein